MFFIEKNACQIATIYIYIYIYIKYIMYEDCVYMYTYFWMFTRSMLLNLHVFINVCAKYILNIIRWIFGQKEYCLCLCFVHIPCLWCRRNACI